ncbi:TetR/AcrR family transcriptional regulator [Microlunatus flavus]|uniref:DNA-binding transcriptional regulator, AcrR family n=1 Tax=Microlunatus flavus TaxID=1036181 RepID=A0A1H9L4B4_9ACTN|nr:TetR/AcrR family transcriptional regulator [Microlunatus flavus]SER06332.1 DNA-binding transcriptional regulator, AcrR family [Microlunatus flavus]
MPSLVSAVATPASGDADTGSQVSGGERRSEARERLLRTASRLFYDEGIRAVGVERILAEAPATRATFYRHFPSKEDLVLAYLRGVDAQTVAAVHAAVAGSSSPADAVRLIGAAVADDLVRPEFRGCAFLKAAAEYADPRDPVRQLVLAHRDWYRTALTGLFSEVFADSPRRGRPEDAAQHFVMMRDGVMSGAHLDGVDQAREAFRRGVEGLLTLLH